jgi:hypothetical protein
MFVGVQLFGKDVYMGRLKNFRQHGKGLYQWTTGSIYYGLWFRGKKHGKGLKTFKSGA